MNKQSTEDFQGSEEILYDMILYSNGGYAFVTIQSMYNIKSEPYCKLRTLVDNDESVHIHPL